MEHTITMENQDIFSKGRKRKTSQPRLSFKGNELQIQIPYPVSLILKENR